jgi:ABC-type sulfate/molybdate transport systems ATPase subunit
LQDEDRGTLLDHYLSLYPEAENDNNIQNGLSPSANHTSKEKLLEIERIATQIRVSHLLQTPLIGLSSGQTRRARLGAVLLSRARMVILEDPFAGLDVGSREDIAELLGKVNSGRISNDTNDVDAVEEQRRMRTILVLRGAGLVGMPKWINKVAQVTEDEVWTGSKEEYVERAREKDAGKVYRSASTGIGETVGRGEGESVEKKEGDADREPVVRMKDVNVAYGSKKVSRVCRI